MTTEEFSNEFDTLLNSYSNTTLFGKPSSIIELDEYEKSIFLTKAQEEIIINIYNGKNSFKDSFERTEEIRRYLSNLIKTSIITNKEDGYTGLLNSSVFYKLPKDLWFITYESVNLEESDNCIKEYLTVVPITQDEYHRVKYNPFRGANNRRILRLDINNEVVELISKYTIKEYLVRYLSKPSPIILTNLTEGLSINGISKKTECELNPAIHRSILEKAVELAITSKSINAGNK